jgi:hypothetical protein
MTPEEDKLYKSIITCVLSFGLKDKVDEILQSLISIEERELKLIEEITKLGSIQKTPITI